MSEYLWGVVLPETAIDPEILFAELARRRIEIHEKIEEYHVIQDLGIERSLR